MNSIVNLADKISERMTNALVEFIQVAGKKAQAHQLKLYLVGGVVRDLLLERSNLDLDLVVEGDAIRLAQELARLKRGKVTVHYRFGTARVQWASVSADLATARTETYAHPGALPTVMIGADISGDLSRRDFTINAMAVQLNPDNFGALLDPYKGRDDLSHKLIRVLHGKSFIDDATRIWRALRYEQRLNFQLELSTLKLLKRDIAMLDTISGDRIRHELELVLTEEIPEKVLLRAYELGLLKRLHPSLTADKWLATKFATARELTSPDLPSPSLYLSLLAYCLTSDETEKLISYLRPPKVTARTLQDTMAIKNKITELSIPGMAPSRIYILLSNYAVNALIANSLATDNVAAMEHIRLYLDALRYVKSSLTGDELKRMCVPEGPKIKEILEWLREARLDGKVSNRKEEEAMVRTRFLL